MLCNLGIILCMLCITLCILCINYTMCIFLNRLLKADKPCKPLQAPQAESRSKSVNLATPKTQEINSLLPVKISILNPFIPLLYRFN